MHCEPDDLCSECWDRQHEADHPEPVAGCLACKLDTITVSAALHAPRATRSVAPAKARNSWERGIVTEERPGGTVMPMVNEHCSPIGVHNFAGKRGHYEEQIRRDHEASRSSRSLQEA